MNGSAKLIVSALLGATITAGTSLLSVAADLTDTATLSDISLKSWITVGAGFIIAFAKDWMTHMAEPPVGKVDV